MSRWNEEFFIEKGLLLTAVSSIIIITLIIVFIFKEGLPAIQSYGFINFIFGMDWAPSSGQYGVFPLIIVHWAYCAFFVNAVPWGYCVPYFLAEWHQPDEEKIKSTIQTWLDHRCLRILRIDLLCPS